MSIQYKSISDIRETIFKHKLILKLGCEYIKLKTGEKYEKEL